MDKLKQIWTTPAALSSDLGLPYTTVHSWFVRESIPATRDLDLIDAAKRRGHQLTLEDLAHARRAKATAA